MIKHPLLTIILLITVSLLGAANYFYYQHIRSALVEVEAPVVASPDIPSNQLEGALVLGVTSSRDAVTEAYYEYDLATAGLRQIEPEEATTSPTSTPQTETLPLPESVASTTLLGSVTLGEEVDFYLTEDSLVSVSRETREVTETFPLGVTLEEGVVLADERQRVVVVVADDKLWWATYATSTNNLSWRMAVLPGDSTDVYAASVSPSNELLVLLGKDASGVYPSILFFETTAGRLLRTVQFSSPDLVDVRLSVVKWE